MRKSILACAFAFVASTISFESVAATYTITYNGAKYSLSKSSTCPNGTRALRYHRKYWCKVTTTTASSGSTTTSGTTTTTGSTTTTTPTAPTTYTAQLSWAAPTTRADGTPLTASSLAGYEIYYTTDDPAVSGTIKVSSSTAVSYALSNLKAGNYYFAMAAIDTAGLKSALSPVAPVKLGV